MKVYGKCCIIIKSQNVPEYFEKIKGEIDYDEKKSIKKSLWFIA